MLTLIAVLLVIVILQLTIIGTAVLSLTPPGKLPDQKSKKGSL